MHELPASIVRITFSSQEQLANERDLLAETAAGNVEAFEKLYQLYFSRLYQFIFHIVKRHDCIEEIINDVMYVVWKKAFTYDQVCRPSTWILGIAYLKSLKSANQNMTYEDRTAEFNEELDYIPEGGGQWVEEVEVNNWLEMAFDKLSTEQRAVVEMTYYQGLHYHEIAEIMQCPENTVKTRMFHARKILARLFLELKDRSRQ